MATVSDLKSAIRNGDTELVRELASELANNGVDISSALELARNLNRTKGKRGKWDDIVEVLEDFFE
jgi:hypothetical protein